MGVWTGRPGSTRQSALKLFERTIDSSSANSMSHSSDQDKRDSKSKKRSREDEKRSLKETEPKRSKSKPSDSPASSVASKATESIEASSKDQSFYWIACQKVLMGGLAYVTKCSEPNCGFASFGPGFDATTAAAPSKHVELDFKTTKKCKDSPLKHLLVWYEDLEPKKGDGVAVRVQRLFALTKCARWLCSYWSVEYNTFNWVYAMANRIKDEVENFNSIMKDRSSSTELKNLLTALTDSVSASLAKISVALKLSSEASNTSSEAVTEALQARISSVSAFDNLYYLLYHYTLVTPIKASAKASKTSSSAPSSTSDTSASNKNSKRIVPPPSEYFHLFYQPLGEEVNEIVASFWKSEVDRVTRKRMQKAIGDLDSALSTANDNPLLAIWHLRFLDYIRFYWTAGLSKQSNEMELAVQAAFTSHNSAKRHSRIKRVKQQIISKENASEPICGDEQQTWRDICRDWPSLIYAYAVPTPAAIEAILKYSPIVEIGAGTGYWSSMLQKAGAKVVAYDSVPTNEEGEQNEFHANVPSFCTVQQAGPKVLRKHATHSLFICFPPPDDNMAIDSLISFTGQHVIHIGEWEGFTGSAEFESHLFANFDLVERVELPNWQDTCYDLTIWKRRSAAQAAAGNSKKLEATKKSSSSDDSSNHISSNLPTSVCFNCGHTDRVLRRCRCCRLVSFCSKACASQASRQHSSTHAVQGINVKNLESALDYNMTKHYRLLKKKDIKHSN